MKKLLLSVMVFSCLTAWAQKKPLTHDVYDGWKSLGERNISNDGQYAVYAINPQEGDGELIVQHLGTGNKKSIARGYSAVITEDSRYVVFKIKPVFGDTRQAKIKKKKPDDTPKDSLGILELGKDEVLKFEKVKNFKTPEKGAGWVVYQLEKMPADSSGKKKKPVVDADKLKIDMLMKLADSIIRKSVTTVKENLTNEEVISVVKKAAKEILKKGRDESAAEYGEWSDAEDDEAGKGKSKEGTNLVVRRLSDGKERIFKLVNDFALDKKGTRLLMEITKPAKDSTALGYILLYDLQTENLDTLMRGVNEAAKFSFDEEGKQLAFVAERDSSAKALQRFYKLWYFADGMDSAKMLADKRTVGMQLGSTVSENGDVKFSRDGQKLFFGTAPIQAPKDTTLIEMDLARLDIWHYNDDYLQPMQLKNLSNELKRSYMAVIKPGDDKMVQLGSEDAENVTLVDEGNAGWVLAESNRGNRIELQWEGRTKTTAYAISTLNGRRTLVASNQLANFTPSPSGKYVYWYDPATRNYFTWNSATGVTGNVSDKIREPLYDVENDVPTDPRAAGFTGWTTNDAYMLINDVYDIWQVDPNGREQPRNITNGFGKKNKTEFNYVKLDKEKRFIEPGETILLRTQNKVTKHGGFYTKTMSASGDPVVTTAGPFSFSNPVKAKDAEHYLVQRSDISESELYSSPDLKVLKPLTNIAEQQKEYNWLTVELVKWKMLDGKMSEGLLYKPENFDPRKKYPVIFYFYERDADGLYNYRAPAPSASIVNVPYFISNEYLIFDPNIYYQDGEPGSSAYNSVVSAASYLSKLPYVDSTRMGLQGQSWGGYQIAYLVTKTNKFKAAWAGAPVSNMTSAYGGIRWGSGMNRQFQYERTQSRIGATLWERQDLYLKNSPLFSADKVKTPLVIMHNDADGAVPWYQGIEYFTALRRLGKKVWMLQYNGEDHNLVQRKNRKDLSIRLGQFFDFYLKNKKPAKWIKEGLPATEKGKEWGLGIE